MHTVKKLYTKKKKKKMKHLIRLNNNKNEMLCYICYSLDSLHLQCANS